MRRKDWLVGAAGVGGLVAANNAKAEALVGARRALLGGKATYQGSLYVANQNNNNVTVYNAQSGALLRTISGSMNGSIGVAFDPQGSLYVANIYNNNVTVYNAQSGALLRTISGSMNGPWLITMGA